MNVVETRRHGPVEAFRLGYAPIGPPLMTVTLYLVDGVLIDTAQSRMRQAALGLLRDKPIRRILLTHHHEDHSGNAAALSARHGAPIQAHPLAAAKLRAGFRIRPYQHLVWGRAQPASGVVGSEAPVATRRFCLTPIHTPGHSEDHTVFLEKENGWLFSGDLYLGERIKFFRADERFLDQILSLRTVLKHDFEALFCGHNPALTGGPDRIRRKLDFLEDLFGTVGRLKHQGKAAREVIQELDRGQDRLVRHITLGNASFANMIRSAYAEA
jgi:glyoxylase-like metal-dependent hydrolase (beta-lactamase superfamily II)